MQRTDRSYREIEQIQAQRGKIQIDKNIDVETAKDRQTLSLILHRPIALSQHALLPEDHKR